MTTNHPITPPPELVRQWARFNGEEDLERFWAHIATQAARWGADQELEACCEWANDYRGHLGNELRAARRPKPPSLKEQALGALDQIESEFPTGGFGDTIRRALEALND